MRLLRVLAVAIAITGIAAVGVATGQRVTARPTAEGSAPATAATMVCPDVSGRGEGFATRLAVVQPATGAAAGGATTITQLTGHPTPRPIRLGTTGYSQTATAAGGPVAVDVTGTGAPDVAAAQVSIESHGARRGLAGTSCPRPAADWWFVGADGRVGYDDELILGNPGSAPTTVQVVLLSSSSRAVTAPSLQAVSVPAHGTTRISLAQVAPDVPDLAVHVRASDGLITASLLDARIHGVDPQGSDWIPSTTPTPRVLVPGVAAGPGSRELIVANPDRQAVTADLQLVTEDGSFAPNGHSQLNIPGRQTSVVDLSGALQQRRAAVLVTARTPILASAAATASYRGELPDLQWTTGAAPLVAGATWAQVWTGEGRTNDLSLAAPDGAARVTLQDAAGKTAVVSVAARSITLSSLEQVFGVRSGDAGWVTVVAVQGGPVYGVQAVHESGAHGPLLTSLVPTYPPAAARVPAVGYDQAIAVAP